MHGLKLQRTIRKVRGTPWLHRYVTRGAWLINILSHARSLVTVVGTKELGTVLR